MCNNVSRSRVTHAQPDQPSPTSPAQPSPPVVTSVETSHHVVQLGDAVTAPDEMMRSALESIEHLDFESEFPCDQKGCAATADWRVRGQCRHCWARGTGFFCDPHIIEAQQPDKGFSCNDCQGTTAFHRFVRSIEPVR